MLFIEAVVFSQSSVETIFILPFHFRYRKWDLGNDIVLIARTEHDAVTYSPNGDMQFMNVKALNEWDSRVSIQLQWPLYVRPFCLFEIFDGGS